MENSLAGGIFKNQNVYKQDIIKIMYTLNSILS